MARLAASAGLPKWVKLEIHPDPHYLLPDPIETLRAAEQLVREGFVVLPYINADPVLAKRLQEVGTATVMPLGSPIGSNRGLQTRDQIRIIIDQATVPVVVDAGIGAPSHAAAAMELGADAVLVNTAIAIASDPVRMAEAFGKAVEAGRAAYETGLPEPSLGSGSHESTCSIFFALYVNILEVRNLTVWFPRKSSLLRRTIGHVKAVTGVSFVIPAGKTVGLVGESGSGKTTVGMAIMNLVPATEGNILFRGRDITNLPEKEFRPLRRQIQIIFQDPFGSLNPRWDILRIVTEPFQVHFPSLTASERKEKAAELLRRVGLKPELLQRFPHEFSGGQRQRIGIARALAVEPALIVCDEPVSALDVSVQAQIVNLLEDLQQELGISYLFISHDLAVVEHISDYVVVMYRGEVVEAAAAESIYREPKHEYTRNLLASVPTLD